MDSNTLIKKFSQTNIQKNLKSIEEYRKSQMQNFNFKRNNKMIDMIDKNKETSFEDIIKKKSTLYKTNQLKKGILEDITNISKNQNNTTGKFFNIKKDGDNQDVFLPKVGFLKFCNTPIRKFGNTTLNCTVKTNRTNFDSIATTLNKSISQNFFDIKTILKIKDNIEINSKEKTKYSPNKTNKKSNFYNRFIVPKLNIKERLLKGKMVLNDKLSYSPKFSQRKTLSPKLKNILEGPTVLPSRYYESLRDIKKKRELLMLYKNNSSDKIIRENSDFDVSNLLYKDPSIRERKEVFHGSEIYTLYKLIDNVKKIKIDKNIKLKNKNIGKLRSYIDKHVGFQPQDGINKIEDTEIENKTQIETNKNIPVKERLYYLFVQRQKLYL